MWLVLAWSWSAFTSVTERDAKRGVHVEGRTALSDCFGYVLRTRGNLLKTAQVLNRQDLPMTKVKQNTLAVYRRPQEQQGLLVTALHPLQSLTADKLDR